MSIATIPTASPLEIMRGNKLSLNQGRTIVALSAGPLPLSALAAHLGVCTAAVTGIADTLEKHHLAERLYLGEDRRQIPLKLTAKGMNVARAIITAK